MLSRLLNRRGRTSIAPPGRRLYAIGDIHGRLDLLDALLERLSAEQTDNAKEFVFLGDYVDRGPASRDVLDRLIKLGQSADAVFLKGNHEAALLDFLKDPRASEEWLDWGGAETLESYGVAGAQRRSPADLANELARALPRPHLTFLQSLTLTHQAGDYLFVHAGLKPGVNVDDQTEADLLWIRREFHAAGPQAWPDHTIVHGHHPERKPVDVGWRIGVDTGAFWTDRLTAVVLEGASRRFVSTKD